MGAGGGRVGWESVGWNGVMTGRGGDVCARAAASIFFGASTGEARVRRGMPKPEAETLRLELEVARLKEEVRLLSLSMLGSWKSSM